MVGAVDPFPYSAGWTRRLVVVTTVARHPGTHVLPATAPRRRDHDAATISTGISRSSCVRLMAFASPSAWEWQSRLELPLACEAPSPPARSQSGLPLAWVTG